jgi:protein-L-isoaspartate(D-aspartate) O-methyltransferase
MKTADHHNSTTTTDVYEKLRLTMVSKQILGRGVRDARVLEAMRHVPRHLFVPASEQYLAYEDHPLPIGYDQTISQPYIVAFMTEALHLQGQEKVLEIGTGSGYQAAVLADLVQQVYTIEIVTPLCDQAKEKLAAMNYQNIYIRCGDGYGGWPEASPFDAIIITAAPEAIPKNLVDQLAVGGRMVLPLGGTVQELVLLIKEANGQVRRKDLLPVRFVPMTGTSRSQQ